MKTAITVWDGRIAPVFDVSGQLLLIESEGKRVVGERIIPFQQNTLNDRISFLLNEGVEHIICGAISCQAQALAENAGISVNGFIAGDRNDVVNAWLEGRLLEGKFAMPGCGRRKRCCRRRQFGN